ncbi:uncharacterized protein PAF06_009988 [Gastrophryne carolinensis]
MWFVDGILNAKGFYGSKIARQTILSYFPAQILIMTNVTTVTLLGFQNIGKLNLPVFILILLIYCVTICGNLLIMTLVSNSKTLHTPMYFFLTQLSIVDLTLTTDITPNMLKIVLHEQTLMLLTSCITQFYFFGSSETTECLLLMVMSYDRYLAICYPLHYASIMSQELCIKLVFKCWLLGCCVALVIIIGICQLQFCGPQTIDHFFCDLSPLLELSCSDSSIVEMEATLLCIPVVVVPFFVIVISYTKIVLAILKISSVSGRLKAFSTCSSHLTVVCMFYGTLLVMYMLPKEERSKVISKLLAMLYTVFTPFLNPLIYSLRNRDIKDALKTFNIAVFKYESETYFKYKLEAVSRNEKTPVIVIPFLLIVISYMYIVSAILKISSLSESLSTCSSHLVVVSMLYGTLRIMYVMAYENVTSLNTIILLGLQLPQNITSFIFCVLLLISGVTICGNFLIITVVSYSKTLHCPMFFLLSQLSVVDILLVIDISPTMLHTVLAEVAVISFSACITQLYIFGLSECVEMLLLTVMSYDRYLAICKPLHYTVIMTHQVCWRMVIISWSLGITLLLNDTLTILKLQFCGTNILDHYFCDIDPTLELSCTDTTMVKLEVKLIGAFFSVIPFSILIVSYIYIITTIFGIQSVTGRKKAFSTCSSHLTVVFIFYGTIICVYLVPHRGQLQNIAKFLSLLYTVVTPMMNPIIYSLRNNDLKNAIGKLIPEL